MADENDDLIKEGIEITGSAKVSGDEADAAGLPLIADEAVPKDDDELDTELADIPFNDDKEQI